MTGPISFGNDRSIGSGATETQLDIHAGKVDIRMIPENAVGNDISKCVNIRDTGTGVLYPIALATPPQEFDLALYDGFTVNGRCFYYKTQESVVHVIGGVNGSFPYKLSAVIGQLPVGFRPSAATRGIAVTNNAPAYIQINTNGAVVLYEMGLDGTPAGTSAFFVLSFVAAD